jgi:hypothetical protein
VLLDRLKWLALVPKLNSLAKPLWARWALLGSKLLEWANKPWRKWVAWVVRQER